MLSFPYPLRFLFASRPSVMGRVLGIVYRAIATHLIKKAGFTNKAAHTGAVTLIQRFGGALNLNIHLHMPGMPAALMPCCHMVWQSDSPSTRNIYGASRSSRHSP